MHSLFHSLVGYMFTFPHIFAIGRYHILYHFDIFKKLASVLHVYLSKTANDEYVIY